MLSDSEKKAIIKIAPNNISYCLINYYDIETTVSTKALFLNSEVLRKTIQMLGIPANYNFLRKLTIPNWQAYGIIFLCLSDTSFQKPETGSLINLICGVSPPSKMVSSFSEIIVFPWSVNVRFLIVRY